LATGQAEALVLEAPRSLVRRSFQIPTIGDDDGLLRVEACGLCGTDHEFYTGMLRQPFAFVPGHEVVGTIEVAGDRALERWGVKSSQRVAVEVFSSCRECDRCTGGNYRRCRKHGMRDMLGGVDVALPPSLWGGYATHLYLPPDSMVLPVPPTLDPVDATLFNPLGAGIRWGVTLPQTKPGDAVVVMGCGLRGLFAGFAAKLAGASFVMVTGWGARDQGRLELAQHFGADLTLDASAVDPMSTLRKSLGRLADVVVDVTSKGTDSLAQAVALARGGGRIVLAGMHGGVESTRLVADHIVNKDLTIMGAMGVDMMAYQQALEILSSNPELFGSIPRVVSGLEDLGSLLATMAGEGQQEMPLHGILVPSGGPQGASGHRKSWPPDGPLQDAN
jgi:alcohol dehydrogenase